MIELKKNLRCDVLIAGGGIAGLSAAIAAADNGAGVIVCEKADTRRSGNGATGNDHFQCFVPEVHGTPEEYLQTLLEVAQEARGLHDRDWLQIYVKESWERCQDWEKWGIPMRPHGCWEYAGHHAPGQKGVHLKYAGQSQKPVLTREAKKRGVIILNHHPFLDLIVTQNGVIGGAICIDLTKEKPGLQVIECQSVILATGRPSRLYNAQGGMSLFNMASCPASGGEGMAAAYEAGARMLNLDSAGRGIGIKYLHRGGKSTWVGLYTDIDGNPISQYDSFPGWEFGDYTADNRPELFAEAEKNGEPIFMNFRCNSDYDIEYTKWGLAHEGNDGTLVHLEDEKFDFRRHMIQFARHSAYADQTVSGIDCNTKAETTVRGLYAAGQEIANAMGGISFAAVSGHIAGKNAAGYSKKQISQSFDNSEVVSHYLEFCKRLLSNEDGTASPDWKEIQQALGLMMNDYCNTEMRSEHLLRVGHSVLDRLEKKLQTVHCEGGHELMRCLEVEKMLKIARLVLLCAGAREETRGKHRRADYPKVNHKYDDMFISIQKINGKPVTGLRPVVR